MLEIFLLIEIILLIVLIKAEKKLSQDNKETIKKLRAEYLITKSMSAEAERNIAVLERYMKKYREIGE
ncbi:hypothetical protein [Fusobacterium sp.]|uniref:hypothetical protein n=1 Tax=Fusobacterium sp. TaxID=68766 RepID=UPI00261B2A49|nr:hypothetical protein [Fusobacterium sp.]